MPIRARREVDDLPTTETYEAIVGSAQQLFRAHGFQPVSVEAICREAGVARSSYYFYFRNKAACFAAVSDSIMADLYRLSGERYESETAFGKIVRANAAFLGLWIREPRILSDYFALALVDDDMRDTYERNKARFQSRLESQLQRLASRGEIQETQVDLLVVCLHSMIQLFYRFFSMRPPLAKPVTAAEALRVVSEAWYRAVYGRPAPMGFDYAALLAAHGIHQ